MKFESGKKFTTEDLHHEVTLFEGARDCYFYTQYLIVYQTFLNHKEWPQPIVFISPGKNHRVKWIWFVKDQSVMDAYFERFFGNTGIFLRMEKYVTEEKEKGLLYLKGLNPASLSVQSLRAAMELYFEQYAAVMVIAGTLRLFDRGVEPRLRKIFFKSPNIDECITTAAIPKKLPFTTREELEVLEIASRVENNSLKLESEAFNHELSLIHGRFAWSVMGYFNEKPKTVDDYYQEIIHILDKGAAKALMALRSRIKEDEKKKDNLFSTVDDEGKRLMETASYASYLKDYFKSSENELEYYAEPLFSEISRRTGLTKEFIKDLHPKEILEIIEGKNIDKNFVSERIKHNIVLSNFEKIDILGREEAEIFEKKYFGSFENGQKEFKGRVASLGFAKGKVKVVLGGSEFHKLEKGDILVVSNTSPDFVPIMRKAAAIIAEEGGLTSHVSVVSREFGIPCVVGILNITEILRDGDLVEVDANKGTVKIIKN